MSGGDLVQYLRSKGYGDDLIREAGVAVFEAEMVRPLLLQPYITGYHIHDIIFHPYFFHYYQNKEAKGQEEKAEMLMVSLYEYYLKHLKKLPAHLLARMEVYGEAPEGIVCNAPHPKQ